MVIVKISRRTSWSKVGTRTTGASAGTRTWPWATRCYHYRECRNGGPRQFGGTGRRDLEQAGVLGGAALITSLIIVSLGAQAYSMPLPVLRSTRGVGAIGPGRPCRASTKTGRVYILITPSLRAAPGRLAG